MPGFGSPSYYGSIIGTAVTGAAQVLTIPASGATTPPNGGTAFNPTGGPAPSRGKVRIRSSGVTGTFAMGVITVTDGTIIDEIAGPIAAGAAATQFDMTFEFNTDLSITSVTFNATGSTAVGTVDVEVSLV